MANRKVGNELARRRSDPGSCKLQNNEAVVAAELPWGALKVVGNMSIDFSTLPAKFTVQNLLVELFTMFEKKIHFVVNEEPLDKLLNKSLRRCDDPYLDNLLRSLNNVSEFCLPSVLQALIKWYDEQIVLRQQNSGDNKERGQKAILTVNYLFCIVCIELLPQISFHPTVCEQYVNYILHLSFSQISNRNKDPGSRSAFGINFNNGLIVAETFAEVIGVLSQSHAKLVQKTFFSLLNELRKETPIVNSTVLNIISLLMAMKFYRIKTTQVSDVEQGVGFLDELASYYLEVDLKQKDLKHAIVGLLVEILLPVAAQIKTEANIPALISFVEKLYAPTYDLVNKKQHKMAAYPLLTCLLCISQSKFFLSNWVHFLNTTLSNLKNRDPKVSRVALESLYRLLWVYIIRNNCEGNTATRSRLESICNSIFPRGSRNVVPRDAPLNIFVKIIHFIAQQKLDFAFKEIIFELLGCNRPSRSGTINIYAERMNIGIRALMVIADGLQQKEGPPGMPRNLAPVASGTIMRIRKTYLTRPLTADIARSIGLEQYYLPCRKAFDSILRTLDVQVGKCLMLTSSQTKGKEPEDLIGSDMKPKLDLFRTCIAAIPRLLPEPMPHHDLSELLIRMTVHIDEELRQTVYLTLQNLISECPDWREDIIHTYINFVATSIPDTFPVLLESSVRFLLQLLCFWKSAIQQEKKKEKENNACVTPVKGANVVSNSAGVVVTSAVPSSNVKHLGHHSDGGTPAVQKHFSPLMNNSAAIALHNVEGFALSLLCQTRSQTKKMAISLMREVKFLFLIMENNLHDKPLLTVLDEATPYVLHKYIEHVPLSERQGWNQDFSSACDKICTIDSDVNLVNSDKGNEYMHWDTWACALSGYCEYKFLPLQCPTCVGFAWPVLYNRLNSCNQFVDPNNPQNENRASLLRSSRSKATASTLCGESLDQGSYLSLWQKYLVMTCALTQPPAASNNALTRSFSPNGAVDSIDSVRSLTASLRTSFLSSSISCTQLFQKLANVLRWEQTRDMRDSIVLGIGSTNPRCFDLLLDELNSNGILREVQDRKNESNVRRRKRRDLLRLQVIRVIEVGMMRGVLEASTLVDLHTGQLSRVLLDLISAIRTSVESDADRDIGTITSLRLHFAKTITLMVNSVPLDRRKNLLPMDKKREFIFMFFSWCSGAISNADRKQLRDIGTYVELRAMHALCAMLCCGPTIDIAASQDESQLTRWIDMIFCSSSQTVQNICEDMLATVLHLNDQNNNLFEFVINQCYTQSLRVGHRYFKSLVVLFSKREYPCDFISILSLCQVYASDSDSSIREAASFVIQILRRQFLDDTCGFLQNINDSINSTLTAGCQSVQKLVVKPSGMPRLFPTVQQFICEQFAQEYPSLTMSIISDLFSRLKTARSDMQASIINCLAYWIKNIELVDTHCDITDQYDTDLGERGYGNEEATQLILNNMLYVTIRWPADHKTDVFRLWQTLVTSYPSNLPIVTHYLFVTMCLAPDSVIPVAKRIAKYLLDACGERFIKLLVTSLPQLTDHFKLTLVKHEIPPYYRWLDTENDEAEETDENVLPFESADEKPSTNDDTLHELNQSLNTPKQLPMPAYGGFYADLKQVFAPNQNVVSFTKSNLALFLLSDLISADKEFSVNWNSHLVSILHVCVLCLDATRSIVCRHARKALINICMLYAPEDAQPGQVASIYLNNMIELEHQEMLEKYSGTNDDVSIFYNCSNEATLTQRNESALFSVAQHAEYRKMLFNPKCVFTTSVELLQAFVFCLSERMDKPLWTNDDILPRSWRTESSEHLQAFVGHLLQYLIDVLPNLAPLWMAETMRIALSINNCHIAGRSFQVASALDQNPTPWIDKMLARLAELVGDFNEDPQCYITNMMLCLHTLMPCVRSVVIDTEPIVLTSPASPTGHNRSVSYTPAYLSSRGDGTSPQLLTTTTDGSKAIAAISPLKTSPSNNSTSPGSKKDARHSMLIENELHSTWSPTTPLNRSKSATTLKGDVLLTNEDGIKAITQLLTISVAMLESHVDNEYLLALNLVDRIFDVMGDIKVECLRRMEKTIKQLDWIGFNGLVGLVSRGVLYSNGFEIAISLLVKMIPLLNEPVIASSPSNAFGLIVTAMLPYLITGFDNLTPTCLAAAQTISEYCKERLTETTGAGDTAANEAGVGDHPFSYLLTMMIQYQDRTFPRDRFQWTKCVINYLLDAVKPNCLHLAVLLSEMLEKCTPTWHLYLLHVINLVFLHGDLSDASPVPINAQVIRIVSRHLQTPNFKEATRAIRTVVDKWNTISVNQVTNTENPSDKRYPQFELYVSTAINAASVVSPLTPRKYTSASTTGTPAPGSAPGNQQATLEQSAQALAPSGSSNADSLRRQTNAVQSKVRERLIGLLTASGVHVEPPNSASFMFSQSNTELHQDGGGSGFPANGCGTLGAASNSAYSSSERISHLDDLEAMSGSSMAPGNEPSINTDSFPRVFKEFDFLEAEHDSISESTESGFNWLSTIRPPRCIPGEGNSNMGNDFINPNGDEDDDDLDEATNLDSTVRLRSRTGRGVTTSADRSTLKKSQRPLSCASESNDISDRTPVQSEKQSDDSCPSCPNTDDDDEDIDEEEDDDELEELDEFKSKTSRRGASSVDESVTTCPIGEDPALANIESASSVNCRSEFSMQETSTSYNVRRTPMFLECGHHRSGQVEQLWLTLVNSPDSDGEKTAHCILLFSQLFRECCAQLSGLLRDASHMVTMSATSVSSISSFVSPRPGSVVSDTFGYFTYALDVLLKVSDCPFLFVTAQFLRSTNLLQPLRFAVYELRQHYETFLERREQCIRALNSMKSALKLVLIGGSTSSTSTLANGNQEIDLFNCLHKLFFQLLQMIEKMHEMINAIKDSANAQEYDLSPAVLSLQKELLACMSDMPASESRINPAASFNAIAPLSDHQSDTIILHLTNKQFRNAILSLRQLRNQYGSEFGCCDHMDVDALLILFCRSHTLRTWALLGSVQTLNQSSTQLKDISIQFATLVQSLVSDVTASIRSSRMSGVNDVTFSSPSLANN